MPTRYAAIDVGSNGIRLLVAAFDGKAFEILENRRESVRLGHDVFLKGRIEDRTIQRTIAVFKKFKTSLKKFEVEKYRAVATSATREATNRSLFLERVEKEAGIKLETISAGEEARLIYAAIASRVPLTQQTALVLDLGGGSVEVMLVREGAILHSKSYNIGAVRMLEFLHSANSPDHFYRLADEYVKTMETELKREISGKGVSVGVATGGNIEALADLQSQLAGRSDSDGKPRVLHLKELEQIIHHLSLYSYKERMRRFKLRKDRADVILPAALVYHKVASVAGLSELVVPFVGLKDGILEDLLFREDSNYQKAARRKQAIESARTLGRRYFFDEEHGAQTARLAVLLCDELSSLHRLDSDDRLLLEIAALLHDIGAYVGPSSHHKHSQYLIENSEILGLSRDETRLVAIIARYHRRAIPKAQHPGYQDLNPKEKQRVDQLAGLVRIADALDREHGAKVLNLSCKITSKAVTVRLEGQGDLLLEKWSLAEKSGLFEQAFERKLRVETAA